MATAAPAASSDPESFVLPVGAVLCGADRFVRGSLAIAGGRIAAEAPPVAGTPFFAMPGLRNAHAHLDLSLVEGVPRARAGFGRWVLDLIRARAGSDPARFQRGATEGARQSLASGTTAVADIDSSGAAAAAVAASGIGGIAFREILGRADPERVRADLAAWLSEFGSFAPAGTFRPGVSPHAPYSTPAALYELAAEHARAGLPLTTHASETLAELEYLRTGGGELSELLRVLGAPAPFPVPPDLTAVEHLEQMGVLRPGALLAHCNYLTPGDVELLARREARVAFCPRSHAFFGHARHPVVELREAGVPVALGTDSLASNGSLSLLDEMAYLRASRPELGAATIFECATAAAAPLLDGGTGRLEPGANADVVVVEARGGLPPTLAEALDAVTGGAVSVVATIVAGRVCHVRADAVEALLPLTRSASRVRS